MDEPVEVDHLAATVELALEPVVLAVLRSEHVGGYRISPSQLGALLVLDRHGSMNLSALAAALSSAAPACSRLCDRLCAAGWVSRGPGPGDRREVRMDLTRAGRQVVTEIRDHHRRSLMRIFDGMSPGDQRRLDAATHAFLAAARRVRAEPGAAYG